MHTKFFILRQLKSICLTSLLFAVTVSLVCCNSESANPPQQPPTLTDSLQTIEPTAVLSEQFASFIQNFPLSSFGKPYDLAWLNSFMEERQIMEISPKDCEKYFYGKPVQSAIGEIELPPNTPFYYVERLPTTDYYITLIFTDLAEPMPSTYLCTYKRDGSFIQGITLHQSKNTGGQAVSTTETTLSLQNNRVLIEQSYLKQPAKTFIINEQGELKN